MIDDNKYDDNWTLQASDLWVSSSRSSLVQKLTILSWKKLWIKIKDVDDI